MDLLFSIIIPVYNVAVFLPRCIDSVMKQCYHNYEVLLIDDGSTDDSGVICDTYAQKYECCRVFHRKNAGVSASRNFGLSQAEGKYIVFLDADDYIEKEFLTKAYDRMEVQHQDICSFLVRRIDEAGNFLAYMYFGEFISSFDLDDDNRDLFLLQRFLQYKTGWEVCFHVFRKDIITKEQIRFDETLHYAEDLAFTFEYMLYAKCGGKILDILYNYTMRSGSATKIIDSRTMTRNIMQDVFGRMQEAMRKKDSNRYDAKRMSLFYAALLLYFLPRFSATGNLQEVREALHNPVISDMQEKQLKLLLDQKKELVRAFGETDGIKLYQDIKKLL